MEGALSKMSLPMEPAASTGTPRPDSQRVPLERAGSPVPSCLSVKSDFSIENPLNFRGESTGDQRVPLERAGSPVPSCLSMKSDFSIENPLNFRGESTGDQRVPLERAGSPVPSCPSMKTDFSIENPLNFRGESIGDQRIPLEKVGSALPSCVLLKRPISLNMRKDRDQPLLEPSQQGHKEDLMTKAQQALKSDLKRKFECIFEDLTHQTRPMLFCEIYTEVYITEGGSWAVNNEHEVRQLEIASNRQTTQETAIICNDIFKPLLGQEKHIRTVLTKGIAGIGKTVSVQKFILDWAEGKANQDMDFIFPLPFRDLNLKKEGEFSLMQLLQHYFPQLKNIRNVERDEAKVVFIFDGLDECRLPLDFQNNESCFDVTKPKSVDVLLTNLIKGNLLPSALLWITSRPAAANQIPPECIHRLTEVRGFNDPQKEEYFKKRIRDKNLASSTISHIKSSRSLYIMCHIPVFCWISATVLETMLGEEGCRKLPKSLTEMYTHFLLIQTTVKNQKYGIINTNPKYQKASDVAMILKLGKLAFRELEKGNLIFYEEDLRESGIDVTEASVYSGVCTEIFKEESGSHQEKVFSFVHLSIQEYLAALFVFLSCVNENTNVLRPEEGRPLSYRIQLFELHMSAVDRALHSKNGHLDLFLRFLLGLSLDSIETVLGDFLTETRSRPTVSGPLTQGRSTSLLPSPVTQTGLRLLPSSTVKRTGNRSQSIKKTVQHIWQKIKNESSAERSINLFHCLNELNDNSEVEEIQTFLRSGTISDMALEPHQCSALAFVLLMSEEVLDEFDLKTYNASVVGQKRLIPVVKNCRKAILDSCKLTKESFEIVASALHSSNSPMRELDLRSNNLGESGMNLLCDGVKSQNCRLETLDLSYNNLGNSGVKLLCAALMDPNSKLQRLGLGWCGLTGGCCDDLASVLRSPYSQLRDLELRDNGLQDSGIRALSAGLGDPQCKLHRLGLSGCQVTKTGCEFLATALCSQTSNLRELDLSYNHPGDFSQRFSTLHLTLLVDHGGQSRSKPDPRKYACQLTLDPNTAHRNLSLCDENRKVTWRKEQQSYPDHPERFDLRHQVVSRESLFGRYYWEAEWSLPKTRAPVRTLAERPQVYIAVTNKGISRRGLGDDGAYGWNENSWSLSCSEDKYSVRYNKNKTDIPVLPSPYCTTGGCVYRVGVCVDCEAGTLSFYSVSESDTLTLLYRCHTNFIKQQPFCAGFALYGSDSSVSLCQLE